MTDATVRGSSSFFDKLIEKLPDLPSWLGGGEDQGTGSGGRPNSSRNEPPGARAPQLRSNHPRLTDWLPYTAYKPDEKLFVLEARNSKGREEVEAVGFAFELTPPAGMSEETISIFTSIIQAAPTGACMQLHLYATNDLSQFEDRYVGIRHEGLYRDMAERRMDYFRAGAVTPLFRSEPWLLRQFRLSLSCTVPCTDPAEQRVIESVLRWRDQVASTLKSINLFAYDWDATELIRYNASILNSQQMFLPDVKPILNYDRGRLVRSQMMDTVTRAQLDDAGQQITFSQPNSSSGLDDLDARSATVRTYSVRSYPESFDAFQAASLIGDFNQTTRAYSCPYLITVGWRKPDFESRRNTVQVKAARATQQAESPMVKFMPELRDKKRDWDIMQDSFAQGKGDVDMYHQIAIFAPSSEIIRAEENAKSVWRARGFEIANDTYMGMQGLFASLPMSLTPALFEDIRKSDRFSTKTVDNVIHTAPMVVEWSGVGDPVIPLSGRRGQIGGIDLFSNTQGNYNAIVVGASGSGKSVFCNELITGYLGTGAKCFVIDVGRSYEKLCGIVGGQYIEFKADSPVSMNPFPMIRDLDEDMEIIQPLIAQMAAGSSGQNLTPFQIASIGKAVRLLWAVHNNDMTITHLRDLFKSGKVEESDQWDKEVSDLATQLDKFAQGGAYAKYFEGPPSINFTSDFVVLELEELKSKKDLQAVILLIMIYRISEEMFLTGRSRKKIVLIDEAWDLLAGGGAAADLIEGGYRRARKYEGAFITATQGIDDYYKTPAAMAAMQNADWMFILRQKAESITALEKSGRLDMNDALKRVLSGIRKVDGEYAEVFVTSPMGMGLLRCVVDPYSLLIYSSKGEDFTRIEALKARGLSVADAITALLEERGVKTPKLTTMQRQLEASYGQ
jgi:conjugal transfer ATP-binding protein TraC